MIIGRIVDSYTNILTLKLFAKLEQEDDYVRDAVEGHTVIFRRQLRTITHFRDAPRDHERAAPDDHYGGGAGPVLAGTVDIGVVAMAVPLTWQIASIAGTVAVQVTGVFENIGTVQEGMLTIARPISLTDRDGARQLVVTKGEIAFDDVSFGYGREAGLIKGLT